MIYDIYLTFTALHSADKFSNEQQILGLKKVADGRVRPRNFAIHVLNDAVKNLEQRNKVRREPRVSQLGPRGFRMSFPHVFKMIHVFANSTTWFIAFISMCFQTDLVV